MITHFVIYVSFSYLSIQDEVVGRGRTRIALYLVRVAPDAVLPPQFLAGFHRTAA